MASRFGASSNDEADRRRLNADSKNTRKSNTRAANTLRSYLIEKGNIRVDFETFSTRELNDLLRFFYLDIRKVNGSKYKSSSLENFRHALNRHLKISNPQIDIIKDREFNDANISYKTMMAELKTEGLGVTTHYPVINKADLSLLYKSNNLSIDNPDGLRNKVQFDIRLYFFRRGSENMHKMTKDTFKLCVHAETGTRYFALAIDERTKNHGPYDKKMSGAKMPEIPGNPLCPVISFIKYQMKLNPNNNRLWQRSKSAFSNLDEEETWYVNSPIGEKKLSTFMSDLSTAVGLSLRYTNHSVRATGATILSKGGYHPAQIMSVTGHKSVSALTVYQRVSDEEEISMGQAINDHIHDNNQQLIPLPVQPQAQLNQPVPVPPAILNASTNGVANTIANNDSLFNIEIDDMTLADFDFENPNPSTATITNNNVRQSALSSLFSNCQINNVTIVTNQKL